MSETYTILIIEDEEILRSSLSDYLEDREFKILTAENGRIGLEIFEREKPDAVLLDLRMPEMDGLEVLQHTQKIMPDIPVIVVSGTDVIYNAVQAIRLGACDYIVKPVKDMSIVLHAINKAIENSCLKRENQEYQEKLESLVHERTKELKEANANLTNLNTRLRQVAASTHRLSLISNVSEFSYVLLEEFTNHMQCRGGSLFLARDTGLVLLSTLETEHVPQFIPFPLKKGCILHQTVDSKHPVLIENIEEKAGITRSGWNGYNNNSVLTLPFSDADGNLTAVLTLHNKIYPPFVQQDFEIGTFLASFSSETLRAARATETLQNSESRFRELAEMLPEAIFESDLNFNITYANQLAFNKFGYMKEELKNGLNCLEMIAEEDRKRAEINIQRRMRKEKTLSNEYSAIRKDGNVFPVLIHVDPIIRNNEHIGYRGVAVDITDSKKAEEELQKNEAFLHVLLEAIPLPIYYKDRQRRYLGYNKAFAELFGIDETEFIGKTLEETSSFEFVDFFKQKDEELLEKGGIQKFEKRVNHIDGSQHDVIFNKATFSDTQGNVIGLIGTVIDITDRKNMEEAIKENEYKLRTIFRAAPIIIGVVSNRIFLELNERVNLILGYSKEELVGKNTRIIYPDNEEFERIGRELYRQCEEIGMATTESRFKRKDGRVIDVILSLAPLDPDKPAENATFTALDITDRRQLEEEQSKAAKLESIGLLAGGIAHDFNNILTVLIGNLGLAKLMFNEENSKLEEIFADSENAAMKAKDLTQQLLTFAKGGEPIKKASSLVKLIKDSADFALRGSNINFINRVANDLWPSEIDEGQISQVINNLIINANQAMPEGGDITISAENCVIGEDDWTSLNRGRYIKISIKDQGIGIPENNLSKIFDPYFTTKAKGSGLGLATSYSIIKRHGGLLSAESELSVGTTFNVYLPATNMEIDETTVNFSESSYLRGNILVMDDEEAINKVVSKMLTQIGHKVECVLNGSKAIAKYKEALENGSPFDVVILDLTIRGGMGGKETIKYLLEIDSEVKAIVSSGYSNDPMIADFKKFGFKNVVSKPYKIEDLKEALQNVLSEK